MACLARSCQRLLRVNKLPCQHVVVVVAAVRAYPRMRSRFSLAVHCDINTEPSVAKPRIVFVLRDEARVYPHSRCVPACAYLFVRACVYVRSFARSCVRACVRACVRTAALRLSVHIVQASQLHQRAAHRGCGADVGADVGGQLDARRQRVGCGGESEVGRPNVAHHSAQARAVMSRAPSWQPPLSAYSIVFFCTVYPYKLPHTSLFCTRILVGQILVQIQFYTNMCNTATLI